MKNRFAGAAVALFAAANLAFVGTAAGAATSTTYVPELVYTVAESGINDNPNLVIDAIVPFGDKVAFTNDVDNSMWVSDGTTAGTHSLVTQLDDLGVTDVLIDRDAQRIYSVDVEGELVFWAYDDTSWELYKTDGTTVEQLTTNLDGYYSLYYLEGDLYIMSDWFASIDPVTGAVTTIQGSWDCGGYDDPHDVVALNGKILFAYDRNNCDEHIAVYDPTVALSGSNPSYIAPSANGLGEDSSDWDYLDNDNPAFIVIDGLAYFTAYGNDGTNSLGAEPFVTDGTQAGTEMLKNIAAGSDSSYAGNDRQLMFTKYNDEIYFYAYDNTNDAMYKTDGTTLGTVEVPMGDFTDPGDNSEGPATLLNGKMLLTFDVDGKGDDWYATDATIDGTEPLLSDALTDTSDSNACWDDCTPPVLFDGHAFFMGYDGDVNAIWVTDGTQAGTEQVTDVNFEAADYGISDYTEDAPLVVAGDNMFFAVSSWDAETGADRSALYKIGAKSIDKLPNTGLDAAGIFVPAVALVATGFAVVAIRRRRA